MGWAYRVEELLITVLAGEIRDGDVAAVGGRSPIPAAATLLALYTHAPNATAIILGSRRHFPFTEGSKEFFDLAQRGGIDLFFLSGVQIDGQGNINLHVVGDYEQPRVRFQGGMGSGMLYYMARRVVLFRMEHSRRVFVPRVDFITASGTTPPGAHRPGGPTALVTPRCVFDFDRERGRFRLRSLHPGVTLAEVVGRTGFEFDIPEAAPTTPEPTEEQLRVLRGPVLAELAEVYPEFVKELTAG
ncbi:MAG: CoA synthetase [Chloroflexota bacterium]